MIRSRTKGRCGGLAAAAFLLLSAAQAGAQEAGVTAMVENPCEGVQDQPMDASLLPLLQPGAAMTPPSPERLEAAGRAMAEQRARDWPNLCRYRAVNAALKAPARVVFMGDSITEAWAIADPQLFSGGVVGRGISGQTSPQMLLRFRADVIDLRPQVVHILAGTNDIAGNTGPTTERDFQGAIQSMAELARANGARVVIGSILPMASLGWRPQYRPAAQVRRLNDWLRDYAGRNGHAFLDYHAALATPAGAFRPELSNDGVHPNLAGYAVMRKIALEALGPG